MSRFQSNPGSRSAYPPSSSRSTQPSSSRSGYPIASSSRSVHPSYSSSRAEYPVAPPHPSNRRQFPLPYDVCVRWEDKIIVGSRTTYAPHDPAIFPEVSIQEDGLWGHYEWTREPQPYDPKSPYLAALPIVKPNSPEALTIHFRAPTQKDWEPHPSSPNTFRLHGSLYHVFKEDFDRVTKRLKDCSEVFKHTYNSSYGAVSNETVAPTDSARLRLATAFFQLVGNFIKAWQDFVVAWRGYQRAVLEIYAFSAWWATACDHWNEPYLAQCERRGFILGSTSEQHMHIYEYYTKRLRLPVYIALERDAWDIPRNDNRERLPSRPRCLTDARFELACKLPILI
jgi:hypothetical protein